MQEENHTLKIEGCGTCKSKEHLRQDDYYTEGKASGLAEKGVGAT